MDSIWPGPGGLSSQAPWGLALLALKLIREHLFLTHKASLHLAPFHVGPALQARSPETLQAL